MQIRQAQRTYRQKKDDTITTLQKKVEKLQSIVDIMNNSLTRFNNQLAVSHTSDLSPQMESGLREMTSKIAQLQQTADVARRESSDDSPRGSTTSQPSSENYPALTLRPTRSSEALLSPTPSSPHHPPASKPNDTTPSPQDLPFGYRISYSPSPEPVPAPLQTLPSLLNLSPQPPYTYSFREVTFANQLERACLERGVYVLANVHLEPAAYRRAFRISRHFSSPELMLHRLKKWLQQPVMKPYGDARLNLGGAGLHYAAPGGRGGRGGGLRSAEDYRYSARARLVAMGLPITAEVEADLRFYEGVWFDMRDVEAYLTELGIRIEPYASVVEARAETLRGLWEDVGDLEQGRHGNVGKMLDRFPGGWNASRSEHRSSGPDSSAGSFNATADVNAYVTDEISTEEWERFCNSTIPWLSDVVLGEAPANGAGRNKDIFQRLGERVAIDVQRLANGMVTCPISAM